MRGALPLLVSALLAAPAAVPAATIRVPEDQPTIQAGVSAATSGDTVVVACGTYYEHDIVMRSGICLTSETGHPDCVTIDCERLGRGIFCWYLGSGTRIEGITVTGGLASGLHPDDCGGGIYCRNSTITLENVVLRSNEAVGGHVWYGGGGLFCDDCDVEVSDCLFEGNVAGSGGGAHFLDCYSPTVTRCAFVANTARPHGAQGGGIYCYATYTPVITSCTFAGNAAGIGGGLRFVYDYSTPIIENTVIAFCTDGEAVECYSTYTPSVTCCDIYGNAGGDWVDCLEGLEGSNGNASVDPLFCLEDNPSEPYSLHEGSPCLAENSPCGELVGAFGQGCGAVTVVEAVSWGAIKAMFR